MNHKFPFRAVVFDMDGTLLDNENLAKRFWRDASLDFGFHVEEDFLDQMIGTSAEYVKESYYKTFGPDCPYDDIKRRKTEFDFAYYRENGAPVKDGALNLLSYLKETAKLPLALATSTDRGRTKLRLEISGLGAFFDYTVCGDEVAETKPSPEIYLNAFNALGVKPSDALVIEDSNTGVQAAINSGANVAWVKDTQDLRPHLKLLLWKELGKLSDLLNYF